MMRIVAWFIFLMAVWMGLTMTLHWQELALGALLSLVIAVVHTKVFPSVSNSKVPLLVALRFIPFFLKELVKANIDVAKIVTRKKIEINPGILALPHKAQGQHRLFILANAITLTPGTLTVDYSEEYLWVHWVDVGEEDAVKAADGIKGGFEDILNSGV